MANEDSELAAAIRTLSAAGFDVVYLRDVEDAKTERDSARAELADLCAQKNLALWFHAEAAWRWKQWRRDCGAAVISRDEERARADANYRTARRLEDELAAVNRVLHEHGYDYPVGAAGVQSAVGLLSARSATMVARIAEVLRLIDLGSLDVVLFREVLTSYEVPPTGPNDPREA